MTTQSELQLQQKELSFKSKNFNDFLSLASDEILSASDQIALIYIAPESFLMGVAQKILYELEKEGYVFLQVNVVDRLTKEQLGKHLPIEIKHSFRWWLIESRFTMGPTAAFLICKKERTSEPLTNELGKLKGYKFPHKADDFTIRSKLPSINGLFNLMHSSDHTAFVLRDSDPFFNVEQVFQAINDCIQIQNGKQTGLTIDQIINTHFLGYQENCRPITFFEIYFKLLYRISTRIRLLTGEFISDKLQILLAEGINISGTRIPREELLEKILPVFIEIKEIIQSIDEDPLHTDANELYCMLKELVILDGTYFKDWLSFLNKLEGCGVGMEYLHKLVIVSTLSFINDEYPQLINHA